MLPKRAYAQIDLNAIIKNVEAVKSKVGPDVRTMAIVKTDAYGHGAVRIASELSAAGVDAFGVATVEEGAVLRRNGITKPILILGYVFPEDYEELLNNGLMHAVFKYENACELSKKAAELNKTAEIHIKIDTGMGRIGFAPTDESVEEIVKISKLTNIEIGGIFTHFACADSKDKTSCNRQKKLYLDFLEKLEKRGISIPVKHMDNSAGIIDYNSDFLDMVRIGIMTYGLYPSDEVDKASFELHPALSLISSVSYVKAVKKGFSISYGSTFTADRDMEIATVSIGYGDGYPRALSNKGRVLINGEYCNIVGRVCMDQLMVDVTGKNVKQGDRVTLVGKNGNNRISVEEVADTAGSFNYEFCCNINMRVPRVYIKDGKVVEISDYLTKL
ncbi:MAG: alanine racemase [Phoenicibacter congonensis]|uniref:Alanine racemase n=1 Tax=Phoenicibacter congonensis TaxID=1944646 RepID=A0AA43RIL1_9ACTN|nr:alanine racemase [Phoenicibacter congonensis]